MPAGLRPSAVGLGKVRAPLAALADSHMGDQAVVRGGSMDAMPWVALVLVHSPLVGPVPGRRAADLSAGPHRGDGGPAPYHRAIAGRVAEATGSLDRPVVLVGHSGRRSVAARHRIRAAGAGGGVGLRDRPGRAGRPPVRAGAGPVAGTGSSASWSGSRWRTSRSRRRRTPGPGSPATCCSARCTGTRRRRRPGRRLRWSSGPAITLAMVTDPDGVADGLCELLAAVRHPG